MNRHRWRVVAFLGVVVASSLGLFLYAKDAKDDVEHAQVEGCQRGNITRAYLLIRSNSVQTSNPADRGLARDLNSIVSCLETKEAGQTVVVSLLVSVQYQCIIFKQRRWPILGDNGGIVYTKPLPGKKGPAKLPVEPCG